MTNTYRDSEQALEHATTALFAQLGWQTADCFEEVIGDGRDVPAERLYIGRETTNQVVLIPRLRAAMKKLNPDVPAEALDLAIQELTRDRSAMSLVYANREIYQLLKDGVKVSAPTLTLPRSQKARTGGECDSLPCDALVHHGGGLGRGPFHLPHARLHSILLTPSSSEHT